MRAKCDRSIARSAIHGFCVLSDVADVMYKQSNYYSGSPTVAAARRVHHCVQLGPLRRATFVAEFGTYYLTTAGDDASGIRTAAAPLPSAGTTQTSDVVASDPVRERP